MKNYSKSLAALLVVSALAACATNKPAPAPQAAAAAPSAATTQAINDAQAVVASAQAPCTDTGNANDLISQAQAAQGTDAAKAQQLAAQAKQTASDSINNCYGSKARDLQAQAAGFTNLNADQQARLAQAQQALAAGNNKAAYDILAALVAELQAAKMTYAVVKGDSLWRIAGKSSVYGNPYQWPLIYKANADKIKHADLIYPKQQFDVMKNPLKTDADAAADYAKHRGAWRGHKADKKDKKFAKGSN